MADTEAIFRARGGNPCPPPPQRMKPPAGMPNSCRTRSIWASTAACFLRRPRLSRRCRHARNGVPLEPPAHRLMDRVARVHELGHTLYVKRLGGMLIFLPSRSFLSLLAMRKGADAIAREEGRERPEASRADVAGSVTAMTTKAG